MSVTTSIRDYCRELLESGSLEAKLRPPTTDGGGALDDSDPGAALCIDRPVRDDALRMTSGTERLPALRDLKDRSARRVCLERFAHHELQAVELFAWALLAFPDAPPALRRGLVQTLAEEQKHLRLYLERLDVEGGGLGGGLSDYFWQHVPTDRGGDDGLRTFLCAMGLTLEQANLDFTLLYRDAFRAAGDEPGAEALQIVHDDEVGHVRLAVNWLDRMRRPDETLRELYEYAVPFPLSAARAKARRFDVAARRRAGLDEDFIEYVRAARPYERGPKS